MTSVSKRKKIRHKIVEILKDASIPGVGKDVFPGRSTAHEDQELPVINVFTRSEDVDRYTESPKQYKRDLQIEIEIQTTHDTDGKLLDELDDLSQNVEDAMEKDQILYNMEDSEDNCKLINDFELSSTLYDTEGGGANPIGSARLVYNIEYYTDEDRPRSLPGLKTIGNDWQANENQNGDAKDEIKFQ